jgi:hypothetical protein
MMFSAKFNVVIPPAIACDPPATDHRALLLDEMFHKVEENFKNHTISYRQQQFSCLTFSPDNAGRSPGLGRERSWDNPAHSEKARQAPCFFLCAFKHTMVIWHSRRV